MTYFKRSMIPLLAATLLLSGCGGDTGTASQGEKDAYGNTKTGALIGAAVGALGGAVISRGNRTKGILIGTAIGAAAGAGIGYSMDQQAKDVAESLDTTVSSSDVSNEAIVVTQKEKAVKITFKSAMMFSTNNATPTADATSKISEMSDALKKYPSSIVQVVGHTDNRGKHDYNMALSERRATSVAQTLAGQGLTNPIYARGCSYDKPLLPNTSESNMAQNRRVEIFLYQSEADVTDQCI